jgi:[ribosomal protein S5]-alanine N-acetyltransferase
VDDNTHKSFIEGRRVYLRGVRTSDANEAYCNWMNDPEITQYLESRFYPSSLEKLREYIAEKQDDPHCVFLAIIIRESDEHIGNIKIGPINWFHRTAEVGIIVGKKQYWGQGYASEAITLLAEYAFGTLNLHKLTAGCYEPNHGSAKAFQKSGFVVEGVRPQHFHYKGKYVDGIMLGLLKACATTHE